MSSAQNEQKPRMLIVEDEVLVALDLKGSLEKMDYEVCATVASAEEAIKWVEANSPDLVLMDIILEGEMDGIDAAEVLRSRFQVPVVFVTAFADMSRLDQAKLTMPYGFVLKPFEERDLKVAVGMALFTSQSDRVRRQAEEELERIFNLAPDMICEAHNDGRFKRVNPAFERILGYTPEEITGKPFMDLVHPDDQEETNAQIGKLMSGQSIINFQNRYSCKDGAYKWLEWTTTLATSDGRFYAAARDITDRKRAEEEIRQLEDQLQNSRKMEAIGTLAGGVAHDFNNILQAISGFAQILLLNKQPFDQGYRELTAVQSSVDRAAQLVNQLLAFSRKVEIQSVPVDLNQQIMRAKSLLTRTIPKMIAIDLKLDHTLHTIKADPVQIEQVLMNLGINAQDAMPDGGALTFETINLFLSEEYCKTHVGVQAGDYVLLSVTDTGQGMDEETISRIFDPYYTTKEVGKGAGLGLSIVYGIVTGFGGIVECESSPGKGTKFKLYFPALKVTTKSPADLDRFAFIPKGDESVLVVDDEEWVRDLAEQMLMQFGYSVTSTSSGEEAIEIYSAAENEIDLVVLDLGMPGMGGLRCLKELKKINPKLPIIIASGYSTPEHADESKQAGAAAFLTKPYKLEGLIRTIRQVLDENGK